MKRVILDFLNGLRIGMLYILCFGGVGLGVFALCILHKVSHAWEAIFVFVLAIFVTIISSAGIYAAGNVDRILHEEYDERRKTDD